jgi:hypothetical protein
MASEYKLNKHKKMRAKARKRAYLKDLAYQKAVNGCWLGDYKEVSRDDPAKFKSHGQYKDVGRVYDKFNDNDSATGKACIIIP